MIRPFWYDLALGLVGSLVHRPNPHHVGFWYSPDEPWLPRPRTTIWPAEHQRRLVAYLKAGRPGQSYMGTSPCRLCDRRDNGCKDFTDGTYVWPEGLAHYVEAHSVELPAKFVQHVLEQ